jgi:hypothetical protein
METLMPQSSTSAQQSAEAPTAARKKPVDKFRQGGVQVSIWENNSIKGAFRAATVQLRYKDPEKGWQTGKSYGLADLENLETAAREARTRIRNWQEQNKAASAAKTAA